MNDGTLTTVFTTKLLVRFQPLIPVNLSFVNLIHFFAHHITEQRRIFFVSGFRRSVDSVESLQAPDAQPGDLRDPRLVSLVRLLERFVDVRKVVDEIDVDEVFLTDWFACDASVARPADVTAVDWRHGATFCKNKVFIGLQLINSRLIISHCAIFNGQYPPSHLQVSG